MRSRSKRSAVSLIAIVFGSLAAATGLLLIGAYVFGAIIDRLGEPDQSLLFWYLPFVLLGVACLSVGVGAIVFGILWRRRTSA